MKSIIWLFVFLIGAASLSAQNEDSVLPDSTFLENLETELVSLADSTQKPKKQNFVKRFFKEDYPSPRKAVILTAVIPGLGQIYNKKLWYIKLPLVYAAFGGLIYGIDYNTRNYNHFKAEYKLLASDDATLNAESIYFDVVDKSVIKSQRDKHDKWKQMSYIGIGLAYILTAAEAYTTAHLLSFDVNDDLSLQLKPTFDIVPENGLVAGFGINFQIGKNNKTVPKSFLD